AGVDPTMKTSWPASVFFFSSRRRHTRSYGDWSSDVCSSDLHRHQETNLAPGRHPSAPATTGPRHPRARPTRPRHEHVGDRPHSRSEERRVGKERRSLRATRHPTTTRSNETIRDTRSEMAHIV